MISPQHIQLQYRKYDLMCDVCLFLKNCLYMTGFDKNIYIINDLTLNFRSLQWNNVIVGSKFKMSSTNGA